jgi:hypothetical protein
MKQPYGEARMTKETTAKKPVQKFCSGAIEVAVWLKTGDKVPFYSLTMSRAFKQGEEWKQADSFSGDDVIVLTKVLDFLLPRLRVRPRIGTGQANPEFLARIDVHPWTSLL